MFYLCKSGRFRDIQALTFWVVAFGIFKTKGSFTLLALKVVGAAYERWSLARGFKYSDLTWKLLVFWKTGR